MVTIERKKLSAHLKKNFFKQCFALLGIFYFILAMESYHCFYQ